MTAAPFFDLSMSHGLSDRFVLDIEIQSAARSIALFGPSGCGKSSVLSVLAGLIQPKEARLVVGGRVLQNGTQSLPPRERCVGLVAQDAMLFPLLDVRANLRFGRARATGKIDFDDVVQLLEIRDLLDRQVRNLSGGESQRIALGRALLSEPELLLLDEPFAPLDEARRDRLVGMLSEIRQNWNLPMVLVSHNPADIRSLSDEVFRMDHGRNQRNLTGALAGEHVGTIIHG
jgi:molybdate transport system ATP-binding protein